MHNMLQNSSGKRNVFLAVIFRRTVSVSFMEIFLTCNNPYMLTNCSFDETAIGSITVTKQSRTKLVSLCYIWQSVAKHIE